MVPLLKNNILHPAKNRAGHKNVKSPQKRRKTQKYAKIASRKAKIPKKIKNNFKVVKKLRFFALFVVDIVAVIQNVRVVVVQRSKH